MENHYKSSTVQIAYDFYLEGLKDPLNFDHSKPLTKLDFFTIYMMGFTDLASRSGLEVTVKRED